MTCLNHKKIAMIISMTDTLRYQPNPGKNTEKTCDTTLSDTETIESRSHGLQTLYIVYLVYRGDYCVTLTHRFFSKVSHAHCAKVSDIRR